MNRKNGLRQNFIKKGGFIATYDKKLLWRANLYIDEGANDWNDLNPWTSAQGNEWDKSYSFSPIFNQSGMPAPVISGQQNITPKSYTWKNGTNYENDSVAYSISCHDSPFEYNNKMDHQKSILSYYFNQNTSPYIATGANNLDSWTETLAPTSRFLSTNNSNTWFNYYFVDSDTGITINGFSTTLGIPDGVYYPYRPGYSSVLGENAERIHVYRSAGVDCVGIIQRSASYTGNTYSLPDISPYNWVSTNLGDNGRRYIRAPNNLYYIIRRQTTGTEQPGLNIIVPGDIVYYWNVDGTYHVMMVAAINYEEDSRNSKEENIILIEAIAGTYGVNGGNIYFAANTRILSYLNRLDKSWIIGRLIID